MKRPLHILVAHNVSRTRSGGMSRIMGLIHDQITKAGHHVDYFCAEDIPARMDGRMTRFSFPLLVYRHAVAAAKSGKPYDLVNIHEPHSAAISRSKTTAGNPAVVVTSHGLEQRGWELALEEARRGREGRSLKSRLTYPLTVLWQARLGLKRANHIFCLNNEDRDYLVKRLRVSSAKITRIFPGANETYATKASTRDYARADRLLFAGTWRKNKGIEYLVPAFTLLAERHPNLTLTVLGAGRSEAEVRDFFPERLRSRISCTQTESEEQNAAVFAEHDVFVLPSLFEGTPLTLVEAMMSGIPVVTTNTCGMKDVIRNKDNGLLVPIRSSEAIVLAVEGLINDKALRARVGLAAHREAVENYQWERVSEPVLEVYERLCSQIIKA